jgi:hypothetical protein
MTFETPEAVEREMQRVSCEVHYHDKALRRANEFYGLLLRQKQAMNELHQVDAELKSLLALPSAEAAAVV